MKFLLDFDGVVFDIEKFKELFEKHNLLPGKRSLAMLAALQEKEPQFDFSSLLFPDAVNFLKRHSKDCLIVSSATSPDADADELSFQQQKIVLAGVGNYLAPEQIIVTPDSKKEVLSELRDRYKDDCIFIDDRAQYLTEAHELGMCAIYMDRGYESSGSIVTSEFERVTNFTELEVLAVSKSDESCE